MSTGYTEKELLDKVDEWLTPTKVSRLYAKNFVNYRGKTKDTKGKYTEVIAAHLLSKLDALNNIDSITRKRSYKTVGHKWKPINTFSPRSEEQIARNMMGKTYSYIGKIIDYQVPLKNKQEDKAGKIDLLSWNEDERRVYILEFKVQDSKETLLRCVLEAYTYYRRVDSKDLLADFGLPSETEVRKAALVYKSSLPYEDFNHANIKKLMKKLHVDLFVLDVVPHYWEGL